MKVAETIALIICLLQTDELREIRKLYAQAPLVKSAARELERRMLLIDSNAEPVLYCYKGAAEMLEAKYALNPLAKLEYFNRGKTWIDAAVNRDTAAIEMRFIRFSIQNNLPVFLGYRENIVTDKNFLLKNTRDCRDKELKNKIINYLSTPGMLTTGELKQISN